MNSQISTRTGTSAGGCGCGGAHARSGSAFSTGSASSGASVKTRGCGCGGSCAGQYGGSCGCTSAGVAGLSAYVRPRFFGGMLLTEDDLQAIDDYTVAKRRLTNRHMFGPGIVCGLEVDCDPCKPGWLTVAPGYALDCCGNDIVVGCPEKVDALALLSDLRRREGLDCGEPCEDNQRRGYILVVSYAEQPTDPVAPYVQDDCAVGDCDFSRAREGYRFELVCEVQDPDPSLFDRLAECAKDSDRRREDVSKLTKMAQLAKTQHLAHAAEVSGEALAVEVPVVADFGAARAEGIVPATALLGRAAALMSAAEAPDVKLSAIGLTGPRLQAIRNHSRQLAEEFLGSDELNELPEVERQRVTRILNVAKEQQNLGQLSAGQRVWLAEGYEPVEAAGVFTADAETVRASIIRGLEETGRGNCRERREVEQLSIHQFDANSSDVVRDLARSYWSVVARCLCDLANPPCPQCTETRVPLATIEIEGCDVTDVCDLTRQWVVAPRNLNYWVPIIDVLRRLLKDRCCTRDYRKTTDRELDFLQRLWSQALSLVRSPLDSAQYSGLYDALQTPAPQWYHPAPATAAAAAAPAATPAGATEEQRVEALEKKVAELTEQLKKLGGGTP